MTLSNKLFKTCTIIAVLCLYTYVIVKAWLVPITYDEAYTIDIYAQMPVADIMFAARAFDVTNNHMLNTLLTRAILHFSDHPFLLRLPAMLGYAFFLYSAYHISRRWFQHNLLALLCFLCFALNPMLSEFFALCRGYALGMGFMMFAIMQLVAVAHEQTVSRKHAYLCGLGVILSVYSLASLLLPSLCMMGVLTILLYNAGKGLTFIKRAMLSLATPVVTLGIVAALIYLPIKHLLAAKALFHGGRNNFVSDTWFSMISDLVGGRPREFVAFDAQNYGSTWLTCCSLFSLGLIIAATLIIIYHLAKNEKENYRQNLIPVSIFWGSVLIINAQFYFNETPLINYRIALYLYPLAVLLVFGAIRILANRGFRPTQVLAHVLTVTLLINFVRQPKFTYTTEWPFDAYSNDVCRTIAEQERDGSEPAVLYAHLLLLPALNFYASHDYRNKIAQVHFSDSLVKAQPHRPYYMYFPRAFIKEIPSGFKLLKAYEDSTYLLYKRY